MWKNVVQHQLLSNKAFTQFSDGPYFGSLGLQCVFIVHSESLFKWVSTWIQISLTVLYASKHRVTAVRRLSSAGFLLIFFLTNIQRQNVYSSISLLIMNYERHFAYCERLPLLLLLLSCIFQQFWIFNHLHLVNTYICKKKKHNNQFLIISL